VSCSWLAQHTHSLAFLVSPHSGGHLSADAAKGLRCHTALLRAVPARRRLQQRLAPSLCAFQRHLDASCLLCAGVVISHSDFYAAAGPSGQVQAVQCLPGACAQPAPVPLSLLHGLGCFGSAR
jgi:hypothetical protein